MGLSSAEPGTAGPSGGGRRRPAVEAALVTPRGASLNTQASDAEAPVLADDPDADGHDAPAPVSAYDAPDAPAPVSAPGGPRDTARMHILRRKLMGAAPPAGRGGDAGADADAAGAGAGAAPMAASGPGVKHTPMEEQIMALARRHPGVMLIVEVGYKMRLFGKDAETAARDLGLGCWQDRNFLTTSFPVQRTAVYVRRLCEAGHRVGVVRQTETAAVKALGSSKGKTFERRLTGLYTTATVDAGDLEAEFPLGGATGGDEGDEGGGGVVSAPKGRFVGGGRFVPNAKPAAAATTLVEDSNAAGATGRADAAYLVVVTEASSLASRGGGAPGASRSSTANPGDVDVGLLAVEVSTGDVAYEVFRDSALRTELWSRLELLRPTELLAPADAARETSRMLERWAGGAAAGGDEGGVVGAARLEQVPMQAVEGLRDDDAARLAAAACLGDGGDAANAAARAAVLALDPLLLRCVVHAAGHLKPFGLDGLLRVATVYRPLAERTEILLSPNALEQLEILRSSEGTLRGSLLGLIDGARTGPGTRLLRRWLGHPLSDAAALNERRAAVAALNEAADPAGDGPLAGLSALLDGLPDLDRGLTRIHHGTARPAEFIGCLRALQTLAASLPDPADPAVVSLESPLVARLLADARSPKAAAAVARLVALVHPGACFRDDKVGLGACPDLFAPVFDAQDRLRASLQALEDLLPNYRRLLGLPSLQYKEVANQGSFLIEVPKDVVKKGKVPRGWALVCSTKKDDRFRPPEVDRARLQHEAAREELTAEAASAYRALLARASEDFADLRAASGAAAVLDALQALAATARRPGYCQPEFHDGKGSEGPSLSIAKARHPVLDAILPETVANDCLLSMDGGSAGKGPRALVVTGPNMGGKSCYIKAVALLVIMAQAGAWVPAESYRAHVVDGLFTRMGASDSLAAGRSTFQEELAEASLVLRRATPRSLVVMDELGRGTSTHDGVALASATLDHLVHERLGLVLFVTHYNSIASGAIAGGATAATGATAVVDGTKSKIEQGLVGAARMDYLEESGAGDGVGGDADDADGARLVGARLTFLYTLVPGVAPRSFGLHVARIAGLPESLLRCAARKGAEMEEGVLDRRLGSGGWAGASAAVARAVASGQATEVRRSQARAQQLIKGKEGEGD